MHPISGLALPIDQLPAQDIKTLQDWREPIAKSVGASVLVTDDADGFKTVADEVGMQHHVCKAHVLRNTEEKYQPLVAKDADGSLKAMGVSAGQATADVLRVGEVVKRRQKEQAPELEALHRRYLQAAPPREGEHRSLAYRLRLLYVDRWNLWHRLTRYRTMRGYKVPENAVRVSRLLAWCGNFLTAEDGATLPGFVQ